MEEMLVTVSRAYYPKVVGSNPTPATKNNKRHSLRSVLFLFESIFLDNTEKSGTVPWSILNSRHLIKKSVRRCPCSSPLVQFGIFSL